MSTGFEKIGKDTQLQDHWLRRLVAFVIDSIIVGVFTLVIALIISLLSMLMALTTGLPWYMLNPFSFPFFAGILSILYFSLMETYYGTTLGKNIMSLKTVKLDGQKPTLDLALLRNASKIYWVIVLLDTIIGLATPGNPYQRITDRVASTTVISKGASPLPSTAAVEPSTRVCSNCDYKIPADAKYCPHCGKEQG
ncbi:RDD family protein [Candidatus Bathyarchaeota archaeon]|nr:RDD family protein [Candidatus Bathyarchaeota archaeon]